jgi:CheY-like chemotaxis protein
MAPTLLLVEDDPTLGAVLFDLFVDEGFNVLLALDGIEALELTSGGLDPDVMVVDVMMPRLDGPGFLRAYAERRGKPHPRAILLSAAQSRLEELARELHASAAVAKPFELAELIAVVHRHAA